MSEKQTQKKETKVEEISFQKEAWEEFACSCGGSGASKLSDLKKAFEAMKKENEELKKELKKYTEAEKKKKLSEELDKKGVELTDEKFEAILKDGSKFESYLEVLGDMPEKKQEPSKEEPKKIDVKFSQKTEIEEESVELEEKQKIQLREKAIQMVREKKAKSITDALQKIG